MSILLANCPECTAQRMTFDVFGGVRRHYPQSWFEVVCTCRNCGRASVFVIALDDVQYKHYTEKDLTAFQGSLNELFKVDTFVSLREAMEQAYLAIDRAWNTGGLWGREVFDTPGWENAVAEVRRHCDSVGYTYSLSGPIARDAWPNWLHILSHYMETGHSLAHAKVELQLVELAIAALAQAGTSSAKHLPEVL